MSFAEEITIHSALKRLENQAAELTAARKAVAAADLMAMAYAGEMASRAAGIELRGFPMLDAYQTFMVELAEYNEVVK